MGDLLLLCMHCDEQCDINSISQAWYVSKSENFCLAFEIWIVKFDKLFLAYPYIPLHIPTYPYISRVQFGAGIYNERTLPGRTDAFGNY